jgi:valyl-tRNA synthetase
VKLRLDFSVSQQVSESAGQQVSGSSSTQALTTLLQVFEASLRLLSPFMPFITEELWHALYDGKVPAKSIALTRYPQAFDEVRDPVVESEMATLQDLIVNIRAARKELEVPEKELVPVRVRTGLDTNFVDNFTMIQRLARVSVLNRVPHLEGSGIRSTPAFDVQVVYERAIDVSVERERLSKELARLDLELNNAQRQLDNEAFLSKAPPKIVERLKKTTEERFVMREKARRALEKLVS